MPQQRRSVPPPLVALAGWLVPGSGYWLIGQRGRALAVGLTILAIYMGGILIADVRVIEVPGFDDRGNAIEVRTRGGSQWIMLASPRSEIANKLWYIPQFLAGAVNLACSKLSIDAAAYPKVKARLGEIGSLYAAVAGMLNLLAIIDSAHRASHPEGARA